LVSELVKVDFEQAEGVRTSSREEFEGKCLETLKIELVE
jgi:hypothetical protein